MATDPLVVRIRRNANVVLSLQGKEPADVRQLATDALALATRVERERETKWGMES